MLSSRDETIKEKDLRINELEKDLRRYYTNEVHFDRMIKEKDLKNSLKPEKTKDPEPSKKEPKKNQRLLDTDQLQRDSQVKRALDILISYGVFSKLNGS